VGPRKRVPQRYQVFEAPGFAKPYKGTGPALADVLSGIITMNFSSLPPAVPQVKVGNLKAPAVTGNHRLTSLPDVPTLRERGIDAVINGWHGLLAPANTPDALLDTIGRKAKQAMRLPSGRKSWPGTVSRCRPSAPAPSSPAMSPRSTPSGARG